MDIISTGFDDLHILKPEVFSDQRGFFMESYNDLTLKKIGIDIQFTQDNQSFSTKGVLRGLHFQKKPHAQTKLVRVLEGNVLDVVVDIRKNKTTYGQAYSIELSSENKLQFLVPVGFAHAFIVLSETASVLYKCDNHYHKSSESGIRFDDPQLNINWMIPKDKIVLSDKDKLLPYLSDLDYWF